MFKSVQKLKLFLEKKELLYIYRPIEMIIFLFYIELISLSESLYPLMICFHWLFSYNRQFITLNIYGLSLFKNIIHQSNVDMICFVTNCVYPVKLNSALFLANFRIFDEISNLYYFRNYFVKNVCFSITGGRRKKQ